jgi:hypothetical protein
MFYVILITFTYFLITGWVCNGLKYRLVVLNVFHLICEISNNFYNQQMHTLYFVGYFIGLLTYFDPYGSSSGYLIH